MMRVRICTSCDAYTMLWDHAVLQPRPLGLEIGIPLFEWTSFVERGEK